MDLREKDQETALSAYAGAMRLRLQQQRVSESLESQIGGIGRQIQDRGQQRFPASMHSIYYTAMHEDQEYSPIRPLIDWLDYNGYTMVTKPTKEFTDSAGHRRVKGNMDIELAIDVMEMAETLNHIILFSGDGDFRRLVEAVQRKGLRVTVVSTIRSQPPMIADELRRQADNFIELQDLQERIARVPGAKPDLDGNGFLPVNCDDQMEIA